MFRISGSAGVRIVPPIIVSLALLISFQMSAMAADDFIADCIERMPDAVSLPLSLELHYIANSSTLSGNAEDYAPSVAGMIAEYLADYGLDYEKFLEDGNFEDNVKAILAGLTFNNSAIDDAVGEILALLTSGDGKNSLEKAISDQLKSVKALVLTDAYMPAAVLKKKYKHNMGAINETGNKLVYSLTSGALPEGMKLASNGKLKGKPRKAGNYEFTITGIAGSTTISRPYQIAVLSGDAKGDYTAGQIKLNKKKVKAGDILEFTCDFNNDSASPTGRVAFKVVLSKDKEIGGDDFVIDTGEVGNIEPGDSYEYSSLFFTPSWWSTKKSYVGIIVDDAASPVPSKNSSFKAVALRIAKGKSPGVLQRAKFVMSESINFCDKTTTPIITTKLNPWVLVGNDFVYVMFQRKLDVVWWVCWEREGTGKLRFVTMHGPAENFKDAFDLTSDPKVVVTKQSGSIQYLKNGPRPYIWIFASATVHDHRFVPEEICPNGVVYYRAYSVNVKEKP